MFKINISMVASVIFALGLSSVAMAEQVVLKVDDHKHGEFDGYVRFEQGGLVATRYYKKDSKTGKVYLHKYEGSIASGNHTPFKLSSAEAEQRFYALEQQYDAQQVAANPEKYKYDMSIKTGAAPQVSSMEIDDSYWRVKDESSQKTKQPTKTFFQIIRETCAGCSCSTE